MGRKGCGPQKIDVFGVVIRNIMIQFLLVRSLVQLVELHKECLPRTRLTGEMVARTRFLVNMCLLWFRHGSLQLKMLGLAMLFRGLLVCVSIWCEIVENILSSEDYAKYSAQLEPPKWEEPTIYQELANKFKEHGKGLSQVEHHRSVVRDAQQKLQKHEGILKELQDRSQILQQEINSLQEQADAEKAASEMLLPPMPPPSFLPEDAC